MIDLRPVVGGHVSSAVLESYSWVAASVCSADFEERLWSAISRMVRAQRVYAYDQPVNGEWPKLLFARYENWLGAQVAEFQAKHFANDPVRHAFAITGQPAACALLTVGPEDIADAFHREWFFERSHVVQRLSLVLRKSDRWLGLHISRTKAMGAFSDEELTVVVGLAQLLLPLMSRHEKHLAPSVCTLAEIEDKLAVRLPKLTGRERQVCARAVFGMTAEGTSLDLNVGIASVCTYRRRAYRRLNISSANELLRLLVD